MNEDIKVKHIPLTLQQALSKAESFCAYQERSHQETRDRLYSWGLHQELVEGVISALISENFLNEERFARAYVSGKFSLKHWGKIKIKKGLKLKGVPDKMINQALADIDEEEYDEVLTTLMTKKAAALQEWDDFKRKVRLANYAISKGYEPELIFDILNSNNL